MSRSTHEAVQRFSAAASEAGAVVHRSTVSDATSTLEELTTWPAVGVELPFEGVSLPDGIETDPDRETLRTAATGITAARYGVVPYGSIVVMTDANRQGQISLHPTRQIGVVRERDLLDDLSSTLDALEDRFLAGENNAVIVTGPSSTGDMGELVTGVHGPAEVHIVVIES